MIRFSGGDARKLLNIFELVVASYEQKDQIIIDNKLISKDIQESQKIIGLFVKNSFIKVISIFSEDNTVNIIL